MMNKKPMIHLSPEEMKSATTQSWESMTCSNLRELTCPAGYKLSEAIPKRALDHSPDLQGIVCIKEDSTESGTERVEVYCSDEGLEHDRLACFEGHENKKCSWKTGSQEIQGTCQYNNDRILYCQVGSGTTGGGNSGTTGGGSGSGSY